MEKDTNLLVEPTTLPEYETPVLLDLEEVVAGCKGCVTGGSGTAEE